MSQVLILDDDPDRHKVFDKILPNCEVYHAYTDIEAIAFLEHCGPFELVCLDHDLGDYSVGESLPLGDLAGSGMDVAEFIALHLEREKYPKKIIIHSWNSSGARRMLATLFPTGIPITAMPFRAPQ